MNSNRNEDYYVGLDMGTGSLGVAVTDTHYNLLKIKGQDFWFVREYETADTQLARRSHRISKRRLQRHKVRIGLIRSYFADDVLSHDPLFYIRQDNSKYYFEDKDSRLLTKDILFAEDGYCDKDYYAEYPTIFHLRKALLKDEIGDESKYSRYLYLAIINMFEHRGHFLLNADIDDVNSELAKDSWGIVSNYIADTLGVDLEEIQKRASYNDIMEVLADSSISRTDKSNKIISMMKIKSNKKLETLIKCLCGLESDAKKIFDLEETVGDEKISINFQKSSYEEEKEEIGNKIGDYYYAIVESLKMIYDCSKLQSIIKSTDKDFYLSYARVDMYEKHKNDLKLLKEVYKKHLSQDKYDIMFRSNENGTYSAYCNSLNSNNSLAEEKKYRRNMKTVGDIRDRGYVGLYTKIKKDLKGIEDEDVKRILSEIDKEQFLPKQITGANGVIPNQIHRKELKKILENAEKHLTFLREKDESGYTVSERIIMLFSNNIPYYVGPIGEGSKTGWAKVIKKGQILPWNIEQKIDMEKTSEKFIKRLVRECTYLSGEKVIPKQSLLYEKFCVLNEINNLKINGKQIVPELKQDIYNKLFIGSRLGKRVSKKDICAYLMNRGLICDESELSGIDKSVNSYLSSYGKMYSVFGERLKEEGIGNIVEEIIYYGTIYSDSKPMFRKKLNRYISEGIITEEQAKRILGYKFKDWGRLSKSMLCLSGCDKNTGEVISIIRAMWNYNLNFMELLHSDEFTFKDELLKKTQSLTKELNDFKYEDLEDYYYSPPVKRMIWQTILALQEITHIMGHNPKRVFIEMTRSDEEKGEAGRKASRENRLKELYEENKAEIKAYIKENRPWKKEIEAASKSGILNSKKLYLYYLQMGRDIYTGEEIDIEDLFDNNRYDIDHIYPRSLTNDNSFENNLVLVSKTINNDVKSDKYPVPESIRKNSKVRELWDRLHKMKFMNDEKYYRLISNSGLTDEQLSGFIARQLVETSQGTKGVADLLKSIMPEPNTKIIYTKAKNVAEFRSEYELVKNRLVNDYHHAKDAYLNIVVGNVYYTKFTQNPLNYIQNESRKNGNNYGYNLYRMYVNDVVRNGEVAWIAQKENDAGTIKLVKKTLCKNTPIITTQAFEQKGELFDLQPIGKYKANSKNYAPLKATDNRLNDVTKYGGYASLTPAYFIFIEHGTEKKRKKCFEVVHGIYSHQIKNESDLIEFLKNDGYINPRIIVDKIKKNTLIKLNGYYLYITGFDARKNVEFSNATPMFLDDYYVRYINNLEKVKMDIDKKNKDNNKIEEKIKNLKITLEKNMELYKELTEKHVNSIYKNHPRNIGECLKKGEKDFKTLGIKDQVSLLCNIVKYTSFEKGTFSLAAIGGAKEVGRIRISGNMTDAKELKIINYSITGMYKNEIDLLRK